MAVAPSKGGPVLVAASVQTEESITCWNRIHWGLKRRGFGQLLGFGTFGELRAPRRSRPGRDRRLVDSFPSPLSYRWRVSACKIRALAHLGPQLALRTNDESSWPGSP